MAKKNISTGLETALVANEPFEYAHLVKFERPFVPNKGNFRTNANRYVYITDAQRDITYDGNIYRAQGVLNVGAFSETTQARATNMTLSLAGEQIGTEITTTGTFTTSGVFNATTTVIDGEVLDFVELGFREGDLIEVKRFNNLNFSDGSTQKRFIISGFSNDNQSITFARTGTDTDDSAFLGTELSSSTLIFSLVNQEYKAAFLEKGTTAVNTSAVTNSQTITLNASNSKIQIGQLVSGKGIPDETVVTSINGTTLKVNQNVTILAGKQLSFTSPSFVNREVFIHKAFINPETGAFFGTPVLNFKGIIASVNIQENAQASRVQWSLTSHWGDFSAVTGRIGTDEIHRSLDTNGVSNPNLTIRPEYASDLGFLHAESSLNTIANYQTTETRTRMKSKKRGGLAGLFGGKKYYQEEYQVQVDNEVDLSVYLQGRYIPVVYGVQRIPGVPIFADTLNNNSKVVYVAYTLAEGEIHGIYNMYIDGAPLICVDKNDFDVRNTNASNSDSQALQCYGRMDRGDTLGGVNANNSAVSAQHQACAELGAELQREDMPLSQISNILRNCNEQVTQVVNSSDLSALYANATAEGLQHEESAKISHPFAMEFEFHSGRRNQLANNLLSTQALSNNFKRQNDYYEGTEPYWGANHRLLDTAYVVMKFTIEADQTTIPEVEYVIKGKVLENYNFDGTFVPSPSPNQSQSSDNFKEGDTVTVEVSSNGTSWSSDGNGNYRILDKYFLTTARGTSQPRFRLDKLPDIEDNTYVRLKNSSNQYWEMVTYDHGITLGNLTIPSQSIGASSFQTNSSGQLTVTLTSAGQTTITSLYGSQATNSASTSRIFLKVIGGQGAFGSLENVTLQALYSGNTLTFPTTNFTANQTISGLSIVPDRFIDLTSSGITGLADLTVAEVEGSIFKNLDTGEEKEIEDYNATTKVIKLESGFAKTPLTTHNFSITGKGKDLRASTNPAIQTVDLLTNERYGKGLELSDIDLASIKQAARVCDTRSDITIPLASATTCVAGDIYKLVDGNGDHVASGKVKTSTSNESIVTLTDVSGKFSRVYKNYITYRLGDIVTNIVSGETRYYKVTNTNNSTGANRGIAPTHGSGSTVGGFEHLTAAISLSRVSGSGPTSLSLAVDGRIIEYSLYDADFVKYWRYLGWEENRQWCVTRHQTNFIFATERSIFENINALLSHYNGILSYSNGKYVLDVETAETTPTTSNTFNSVTYDWNVNPEYIDNTDIIGSITINDNSQRNAKNTIKASIADPQNNFSSRSVSFFNSDFLKADRNVIKTGNYPVTGITSYYNARIGIEKELIQSRYSKEISFTVGQKGLLLKPGAVIAVTYDPFDFSSKLFRIENLTHNANCTTSIKAREYDDSIYAVTPQISNRSQEAATSGDYGLALPGTPASLSTTTTKPGVITLNWSNASDYKEVIDSTEIWRANTQGSSGDITSHATLVTVVDNATTFSDALGEPGTFYYWIRHRRMSRRTSDNAAVKLVGSFSTAITAGVSGTAKVLSPQLDVDVSSIQIKFNDSGALTPSGTAQDVKLTATLRNITPNASGVVFTLVDADQTSQTDVQFTNGSTTLTDTSSPYEATVDASSASNATTNKFVKVTTTDTGGEVFTELVPISVTKDGSSGSTGIAAAAVKLEPSTSVITYSANDPDNEDPSTTITFTTDLQGNTGDSTSAFSGTPYYEFLVDGTTSGSISTTSTFTLPQSDEPADKETVEVKVKVRDGSTSGTVKATDSVTIFGIKSGSDAITAFLTNSSHVVSAANDGTVSSFTGAGGTFKVFVGSTDRTTSCTFSEVANAETSGLTSAINSSTGVYEVTALSVDLAQNTFRATIPANISPTGVQTTIDQTYSISKSKQGTAGAGGTDAKTVRLTAADYSIVYDEDGANPSPSGTVTLTATHKNFSNPVYQFVIDGTAGSFASSATGSFTIPSSIFNTPKTMQVNVKESGASSTEAFDSISIFAVKSGANAYTVILDNEAHAIPADKDGNNAVMTGSGCTISVFKGSNELNGITSGTPGTSQFKVTVSSDDNITASSTNGTSGGTIQNPTPVVFAAHSSLTAATANIIYSIDIEGTQTVLKKQSFTRVDKGDTGAAGDDGTNNAEVKIYQRSNNATSAPAVPDNNLTYKFSTGKFTVNDGNAAMDSWAISLDNAGTGQYLYTCTAKAVGTNGADETTVAPSDWSTPVRSVVEEPRTITDTIFNTGYNYGEPSDLTTTQLNALKYDFSASNFATSTLPSGWSNTRPATSAVGYTFAVIKVVETAFEGDSETASNQTKSIIYIDTVSKWGRIDIDDVNIGFQDEDNIRIRFGNTALGNTTYQTGSVDTGLKNSTIEIDNSSGQISGIGTGNNSRVFNDVIGISLDSTTNVGRLTISGVGTSNTTADITKTNLGLQYDDGATVGATLGSTGNLLREDGSTKATDADVITSQGTAANTSAVGTQSVANAQTAVIAANAGLTSAGVVKKLVPKEQGGLAEDISAKTGVLDFSSGTANFRTTLPTNRGGFGLDVGTLFGSNVGRFPRWNGSGFTSVADNDYINSGTWTGNFSDGTNTRTVANITGAIDGSGRIVGDIFDGTNTRSAGNITGAIDSSGRIVGDIFDGTNTRTLDKITGAIASDGAIIGDKIPLNPSFLEIDSGNIKIKNDAISGDQLNDNITYSGKITAGTGNNVAILDGANSTYRIYAGNATPTSAKFSVTQTGSVYAEEVFIGSTSGLAMGVSTGTNRFQIRTPDTNTVGTVLEVGGDTTSTYIPLKVKNDGTGEIRGFDILTSGGTKLFDASTGFTDAAFSEIAEATGSSVSSIAKTSSGNTDSDSQKISLTTGQTITVKAQKSASFAATGLDNNTQAAAISEAYSRVPNSVTVKVLHNTSNSRSGATQVGGTLSFTEYSSGTQSATQYRFDQFVESEPGFHFAEVELSRASFSNSSMSQTFSSSGSVGAGTAAFTSDGNFTLEFTHTISSGDHYYWIEIGGSGSFGNGTVNDVTDDSAVRTLTLTAASGSTFNVSGGDGNEASDDVNNATITLAAGTGLTNGGDFTTNQGVAETITFNVGGGDGITANADDIAVDSTVIRTTGNQTLGGTKTFSSDVNFSAGIDVDGIIDNTYNNGNVSPPSTSDHTAGTRIKFYDSSATAFYAIGIESNHLWYNADQGFKWYEDAVERMTLSTGGNLSVDGTISSGNIRPSYSALGRAFRASNRGELHLNATGAGDVAEIFFGYGDGYAGNDNSIRWAISDRGTTNDQLIIYKGPANGGFHAVATFDASANSFVVSSSISAGTTLSTGSFTLPNSIGSAGQVLKVPSSGTTLEWASDNSGSGSGGLPSGMTYSSSILDVTGTIRATADVIAYYSSDYRLKDNVKEIDNALEKVSQIRGVEFDWNEKQTMYEGHDIGVIAQEVEKVAPEIVVTRDDGYKAVNYQKLTALLIEAVKELKEEIKELKKDK